ncbi:MAG: hypothetical protein OEY34_00320 [Cyclobacteriaceae bacterium]|nr:hypothetical protein [Cyclobacteriaceae bacterium]
MKRSVIIGALLLLIPMGCLDIMEDSFELPWTGSVIILQDSRTLSSQPDQVNFEMDFAVIHAKIFESIGGEYTAQEAIDDKFMPYEKLNSGSISYNSFAEEPDFSFSLNNMSLNAPIVTDNSISLGVLLDTSEPDYKGGFGFNNFYMEGLVGMLKTADPKHEFLLAKYQRKYIEDPPIQYITNDFTTYSDELAKDLWNLPKTSSDFASLYDALDLMIEAVAAKANNIEKHILVYATSIDNGSVQNLTENDIILKALQNNVKISVVFVPENSNGSNISDWRILSKVPVLTGGTSIYAGGGLTGQVNTVFLNVFDIIQKNYPYYTLNTTINNSLPTQVNPFVDYFNYLWISHTDDNVDGFGSSLYLNHPLIYYIK